jgi:hypothetical protein
MFGFGRYVPLMRLSANGPDARGHFFCRVELYFFGTVRGNSVRHFGTARAFRLTLA